MVFLRVLFILLIVGFFVFETYSLISKLVSVKKKDKKLRSLGPYDSSSKDDSQKTD